MSALSDTIVSALTAFLRVLFTPVEALIEQHANSLVRVVVSTPHPNATFRAPTNGVWPGIYQYYWDSIVPLALFLWAAAIGLVIFFETTSHLFSGYHRAKLKRRAFVGLLGILAWWWLHALALQFVSALTAFLTPDLSSVSLFQTLSFATMGVLGLVVALATDFLLFLVLALLYFTRQFVLLMFGPLMPILIVFWIPAVGPLGIVASFVRRFAGFYVPFLLMTLPVAVLFRLGHIIGTSVDLDMGGVGLWLGALVIPVVAVLVPLVMFWQAGALFFAGDRAARHLSETTARARLSAAREGGTRVLQGGRNLGRGVRGQPAVDRDGQQLLDAGAPRTHAFGDRLRTLGHRVRASVPTGESRSAVPDDRAPGTTAYSTDPGPETDPPAGEDAGSPGPEHHAAERWAGTDDPEGAAPSTRDALLDRSSGDSDRSQPNDRTGRQPDRPTDDAGDGAAGEPPAASAPGRGPEVGEPAARTPSEEPAAPTMDEQWPAAPTADADGEPELGPSSGRDTDAGAGTDAASPPDAAPETVQDSDAGWSDDPATNWFERDEDDPDERDRDEDPSTEATTESWFDIQHPADDRWPGFDDLADQPDDRERDPDDPP